jgi:predicted GIY-YIG superfamily endonuclease
MSYSYVLLSEQDGRFYNASDLQARLQEHNAGAVRFTAKRDEEGAISNDASALGWRTFVATSGNGTRAELRSKCGEEC